VDFYAEVLAFLAYLSELVGDRVQLGGDGHYARDGGTEDGEDGAFAGSDGLEGLGGKVLHQVGVELEAVPGLVENFCQEGEGGEGRAEGEGEGGS